MTLQQLRYFCVMANVLHYTRAAEQLYISQPSLSYALNELEKELGVPLFEKRKRKTYLTEYGSAFLPFVKQALTSLEDGQAVLTRMCEPTGGSIKLGYIYSVGISTMPDMVDRFYRYVGNRDINFSFQQSMTKVLTERLLDGSLDVVLSSDPENDEICALPVHQQELFLLVHKNHPLASRESVTLSDLAGEDVISISQNAALYRFIGNTLKQKGLTQKIVFEVDECTSIAAFVSAGAGVAVVPGIPIAETYPVCRIPFENHSVKRDICLCYVKDRHLTPAALSLIEFVKNGLPEQTDSASR